MSFNTEWDVDNYRTEYESEEHWQLRRNFMVTHKDKFPEERLVCLAQVFTNIEFLGCRYPAETMQLVEQLSEGVADDYREKQKNKLQRTFVKASDAAGAKVKGLKRPATEEAALLDLPEKIIRKTENSEKFQNLQSSVVSCQPPIIPTKAAPLLLSGNSESIQPLTSKPFVPQGIKFIPPGSATEILPKNETDKVHINYQINKCEKDSSLKNVVDNDAKALNKEFKKLTRKPIENSLTPEVYKNYEEQIREIDTRKFGKLILLESVLERNPFNVLSRSCTGCRIPFSIEYSKVNENEGMSCKVFVNNHLLTSCLGVNKKDARDHAMIEAYEKLKQICYVLKVKAKFYSEDPLIEKPEISEQLNSPEGSSVDKPMEENIGTRLMRAMGWTGGGLGKEKQGIEEPISVAHRVCRSGIGVDISQGKKQHQQHAIFRREMFKMLEEYARKETGQDLVFSSDFTKEERAMLHKMAQRLSLTSRSYGKDDNRSLVISKKKNYCQIVEKMLRTGEYSTPLYELVKPPISLPLDHNSQLDLGSNEKRESLVANPVDLDKKTEMATVCQPSEEELPEVEATSFQNEDSCESPKNCNSVIEELDVINKKKKSPPQINNSINAEPYGQLVLLEDETCLMPIQIIEKSASACHVPFRLQYSKVKGGMVCKLYVNNILVTSNTETSKKKARELSVSYGLKKLRDKCYSLKITMNTNDNCLKVTKCLKKPTISKSCGSGHNFEDRIICNSKQLDWPTLGWESKVMDLSETEFKSKIRDFLCSYLSQICPYDIVVPPDFTAQEMTVVQQTASNLGLKVNKYHLAQKDFLRISKKLSLIEVAQTMLSSGGNE